MVSCCSGKSLEGCQVAAGTLKFVIRVRFGSAVFAVFGMPSVSKGRDVDTNFW